MQRQLTLRAMIVVVIAATSLVASLAIGFLLRSTAGATDAGGAASGVLLGAAVYAPFGLVALLLPALAVPIARLAMTAGFGAGDTAGPVRRWPAAVDAVAMWGGTEVLLQLLVLLTEPGGSPPPVMHLLLALYAAIAAWQLNRRQNHDDSHPPPEPS